MYITMFLRFICTYIQTYYYLYEPKRTTQPERRVEDLVQQYSPQWHCLFVSPIPSVRPVYN